MDKKEKRSKEENKDVEFYRRIKKDKLSTLSSFSDNYNSDEFIADLENYFGSDVDFNLSKIRQFIERTGKLERLITQAKEKNTHPVTEFVQELFRGLVP